MSIELILMGLGIVLVCLIIEDAFDAIWKAAAEKRRKAEEEERLQRVERIIAEARMMAPPVIVEEPCDRIEVPPSVKAISYDAGEIRYPPALPARFEP